MYARLKVILLYFIVAIGATLIFAPSVFAENYIRWDTSQDGRSEGETTVDIVWKDHYWDQFNNDTDDSGKSLDTIRFRLNEASRDNFKFTSENAHLEYYMGEQGVFGAELYCIVSQLKIEVDIRQKPNKITKLEASEVSAVNRNGSVVGDAIRGAVNSAVDTCEDFFNDDGQDVISLGYPDKSIWSQVKRDIDNEFGNDAALSALLDQLDEMKGRERTHFQHRVCGTKEVMQPTAKNAEESCVYQSHLAYDKIWELCTENAKAVSNATERVERIKQCIEDYSGVSVNGDLLDGTLYREINYADGESCSVRYIGWVVCPLSRFLAKTTDTAGQYLQRFFTISPLQRGQPAGDALYEAWRIVASIANAVFILAFLLIIFSQITGRGVVQYGVKALIPRLIMTAVLVNVSYILCVIAVDISNILGSGLFDIFKFLEPTAKNKISTWSIEIEHILIFTAATVGAGLVLLSVSLVAMFPLLIGAALSFIVSLIMIIARYAIILVLIIIAPLAIACMLLPGTRKWWSQWLKIFLSMLLLYPMVAILFGGAKVAGIIILNSSVSRGGGDVTLQLFALAVQALPLALTPMLMLLSGNIISGIGSKVSGSKMFGKARQGADGYAQRKKNQRDVRALRATGANKRSGFTGLRDRAIQRKYRRIAKRTDNKNAYNAAFSDYTSGYVAGNAGGGGDKASLRGRATQATNFFRDENDQKHVQTRGEAFASELAKGGGSQDIVRADALKAQLAVHTDTVKAAKGDLETRHNMDDLTKIASGEVASVNEEIRQAAIELVMENGSLDQVNSIVKSTAGMTGRQRQATARGVSSSRVQSQAAYYSHPAAQEAIMNGQTSGDQFTENIVAPSINQGRLSASDIGSMHSDSLKEVHKALSSNSVSASAKGQISNAASRALQSKDIRAQMHSGGDAENILNQIANHR